MPPSRSVSSRGPLPHDQRGRTITTTDTPGTAALPVTPPTGPQPLRSAVVFNPVRVTDIDERRVAVEATLAEAGWPAPTWIETTVEDQGAGQARQAAQDGAQVVFACGGDGTVRSCIEGLLGTDTALAVLPAGTGNLLAANLEIPDDPAAGARLATEGGRRRIDIGDVDGQAFAVMAGMGFDAAMLDSASTKLKSLIGAPAYVLSALKHLRDRRMTVTITLDDHPPVRRRARTVVVANVGRLQGGVRLVADAEPDNGQLDVAVLAPKTIGHWLELVWGVLRRRRDVAHMDVMRATRVTVTSDSTQPRQLDGDTIEPGRTLTVTVRPATLELCVPQPDQSRDLAEGSDHLDDEGAAG